MTHFNTENGMPIGTTFADSNGRAIFLNEEEALLLFSLDFNIEIFNNNNSPVRNVEDMIELFMDSHIATEEEVMERFGTLNLRPKSQMFITEDGEIVELIKK